MAFSYSTALKDVRLYSDGSHMYVVNIPSDYDAKTHEIVKVSEGKYVARRKMMLPEELFEVK